MQLHRAIEQQPQSPEGVYLTRTPELHSTLWAEMGSNWATAGSSVDSTAETCLSATGGDLVVADSIKLIIIFTSIIITNDLLKFINQ